ncbi:methyltransferase [Streptomyces sp. NPDC052020]|uniref:methyltransferase n=1 Tax=Streptomyces sp. NPDC052020 TaxID=3155677 RepID=UPI00343A59E4
MSPLPLLRVLAGVHDCAALRAGIELRVFDALADGPREAEAVARAVDADARAIRVLLDVIVTIGGVLVREEEGYALTPVSRRYLLTGGADYLGAVAGTHLHDFVWEAERRLAESVRAGGSVVTDVGNPHEHPFWRAFAEASGWIAAQGGQALAELLTPWARERAALRVLDLCAGSGRYGCALAAALPQAEVTLLDWPGVLAVRRDAPERRAVRERVGEIAGDLFTVPYGEPYDLILLNNVLHNFGPDRCEALLERVAAALRPGGRVVVQELVPTGADAHRDHVAHVFSMMMLALTAQGRTYSLDELTAMLGTAGLEVTSVHDAPDHMFTVFLTADRTPCRGGGNDDPVTHGEPTRGGRMHRELIALALRVRPGQETALARVLAGTPADGPRRARSAPAVATFTAAGRVVHLAGVTEPLAAPDRLTAGMAGIAEGSDEERSVRALCRVPEDVSTAAHLAGARLDRRAHHVRPGPPAERVHHRALLYPVRPGHGEALCRLLAAGVAPGTPRQLASALVSSTVYGRDDTVVRYWTAPAEEELDNVARVAPRSGLGARLNRLLDFAADLTTPQGFRAFFTACAMTPVS